MRQTALVSQRVDELEASQRMFLGSWESKLREMMAESQKSMEFLQREFESKATCELEEGLREFGAVNSLLQTRVNGFEANYTGETLDRSTPVTKQFFITCCLLFPCASEPSFNMTLEC